MAFVDFVFVAPFAPIFQHFQQTDRYVCCLSAEKKNGCADAGILIYLNNQHFQHNRNPTMLAVMLLYLRSAVADYLPQGSPICSFGVGHAPKVLWGYKRRSRRL